MRHGEAERAAAVEGAKKVFDLDIGDLCVDSSDMNLKVAMIRVIMMPCFSVRFGLALAIRSL